MNLTSNLSVHFACLKDSGTEQLGKTNGLWNLRSELYEILKQYCYNYLRKYVVLSSHIFNIRVINVDIIYTPKLTFLHYIHIFNMSAEQSVFQNITQGWLVIMPSF